MRRLAQALLLILCCASVSALAEESKKEKYLEWHTRDLYYYDANGIVVQLELAPKLSIRFTREMAKEDRTAFLAEFSPIAEMELPEDSSRTFLSFHESITPSDLLQTANKISASGKAEANPVFFVENIESVLEGIVVKPKTFLSPARLQERMRKYGDFMSRQTLNENGVWVFLIDEVKPPLNLLLLTNLISNDSWVERAFPRFKFLHNPIVSSIIVEPVSGTVGEVRKVIFTVKVFDPSIVLSTERLPEFGNGLFRPIQGSPSSPGTIRDPGYLFEQMGDPVRYPVKQERRSRTYAAAWKFRHYALGEWTIPPQPVPYSKNGVDQEIKSSGFTLVVNSQIGSLKITDIPIPRPLIHPVQNPAPAPDLTLPPVPAYWFDAWLPKPELAARYTGFAGKFFGALVLIGIIVFLVREFARDRKKAAYRRQAVKQVNRLFQEASATSSYAKYEDALSAALVLLFPHLTSRPAWEEIKDDKRVLGALGSDVAELLEKVFTELGRRHMRGFSPAPEDIAELNKNIRAVLDRREWRFVVLREVS